MIHACQIKIPRMTADKMPQNSPAKYRTPEHRARPMSHITSGRFSLRLSCKIELGFALYEIITV